MDLSLEQAIGQKLMLSFVGREPSPAIRTLLRQQHVGGITLFRALNISEPTQVRRLTTALQAAAAEAGMPPLLIAADQEGGQLMAIDGGTTCFPGNLALGATGSAELTYRAGYAIGRELAAMGVNVNYAPICDVNSNPHNPVIGTRSFGEDPAQVMRLSAAMVRGMQAAGVAATAKHFPGHGDTSNDSHGGVVVVPHDRTRISHVEMPPFMAAIEAGVRLVMTSHLALPAFDEGTPLPATLSATILRGLLRRDLGFDGVIVSDALDMAAIAQGPGLVIDALAATAAGVDLLLLNTEVPIQQQVYAALVQATQRRLLAHNDVMDSAARILALKRWLAQQPQPPIEVVGAAEHQALAAEIAARSVTLVRDEAQLLPLRLAPDQRVAVILPRPVDLTPADTSSYVACSLAAQLRAFHPAIDEFLTTANPDTNEIAGLAQRVSDYDLVIVGTINATAQPGQAALVRRVLASATPTLVVALRTPYDLSMFPEAPTYLCTYSILQPALAALAQALWGQIPFSGRLPVSIPNLYPLGHGLLNRLASTALQQGVANDVTC